MASTKQKVKLVKKESREKNIGEALAKQDHPRGETLSKDQRVYRINVATAFLKPGVLLANFRDILEEHAYRLSDRRGMRSETNQRGQTSFTHF